VLVSAFIFGGVPEKAVRKAFLEAEIFVSPFEVRILTPRRYVEEG